MEATVTPDNCCPFCGYKVNRATDPQANAQPNAGDWSVCFSCAALMVFNADLTLRKPTEKEAQEASKSEALYRLQLAVRRVKGQFNGKILAGGGTA